jgi:phosphoglycolate phosphatase
MTLTARQKRFSLKGEEILVIGVTPLHVRCGRAIGAKVFAVATGMYSVAELVES